MNSARRPARRVGSWVAGSLAAIVVLLGMAHVVIVRVTGMSPPVIAPLEAVHVENLSLGVRVATNGFVRWRGKIAEVHLSGSPEAIGAAHAQLLDGEMRHVEEVLWHDFESLVPSSLKRTAILDLARLRFSGLDQSFPLLHRQEIAAQAAAFAPNDPMAPIVPTYQRMIYLNALYDVSLSFEHSALVGCTSFALTGDTAVAGHAMLARNFDFEAGDVFDSGKALFVVHEAGKIPYASVAWPGLIGAVSGVNAEGLALVVHGARAQSVVSRGEPVVLTMRDVLATARNVDEAVALLGQRAAMVSHLVMLVDAAGSVAIVERAPGAAQFVRRGSGRVALTNHLEGPLASDPANLEVERTTSTKARRARLDELLARLPAPASPTDAVAVLRDHGAAGGQTLAPGDRRAIDANIATHGIVVDTTARTIWVSEGPHLGGRFIRFDLGALWDAGPFTPSDYGDGIVAIP